MGTEKTSWEEAKADILGLFMVTKLIEMGEITNITAEDAITTYIAAPNLAFRKIWSCVIAWKSQHDVLQLHGESWSIFA